MTTLSNKKIIITGATGGIGAPLVKLLAKENAELFLLSSRTENLQKLQEEIGKTDSKINLIEADLSSSDGIKNAAEKVSKIVDVDILINLAGISYFGSLGLQKFEEIEKLYNVNVLAPTILSQAVLPEMIKNRSGHIVNIGSIFGSIAFPFFATYSASKSALRGFSEALSREVCDSQINVSYVAPRAVKTSINEGDVSKFLAETKTVIDEAEAVAKKILKIVKNPKSYSYFGFPECLFVRLNYLLPSLVSSSLTKQSEIAKRILLEGFKKRN